MSKYRYLLFDADNTLFDFDRCEYEALQIALCGSPLEFSPSVADEYHTINDALWKDFEKGLTTRDILRVERYKRLFECHGLYNAPYVEVSRKYETSLAEQRYETDGAFEILSSLYEKYKIYVITNGLAISQKSRFGASRLNKFFDKIYISEELGTAKPSADFFDKVIADIGDFERERYLVIGDSPSSDILGAKNAGLDSCLYSRASHDYGIEPTYTVHSLLSLKDILL